MSTKANDQRSHTAVLEASAGEDQGADAQSGIVVIHPSEELVRQLAELRSAIRADISEARVRLDDSALSAIRFYDESEEDAQSSGGVGVESGAQLVASRYGFWVDFAPDVGAWTEPLHSDELSLETVDRLISGEGFSFDDAHPDLGGALFPGRLDPDRASEIYAELFDYGAA